MNAKEMLDFVEKAYEQGNMPVWDYEKFKEQYKEELTKEQTKNEEIEKLKEENKQLKKCNSESITFLNQDNIRDMLLQKDYKIFCLQQRIDKAIEYLKDNADYCDSGTFCSDLRYDECLELLSILKGEDNE